MAGALIIGVLWGVSEKITIHPDLRAFMFIGILGGFTTFSTFMLESFTLMREGQLTLALMNILLQNILGMFLVIGGFIATRYFLR